MKNLRNYKAFLNENAGDYGNVNDPMLNVDPFKRHVSDMAQQMARLQGILASTFGADSAYGSVSVDLDFEISDLKIIRIFPSSNGALDIYLRFIYEDSPYYAVFRNWGGINGAKLETGFFTQIQFNRENKIKFEGILRRILLKWFNPPLGEYTCLKEVKTYDDMGELVVIPIKSRVEVSDVFTEENKPVIYIKYKDKITYMSDNNYYYFNWWFTLIEKDNS